jgi:subtilisin family serine protease
MIEELEKDPEVTAVYISRTYELQIYNTARTVKANSVWNSGYSGSGVQVAIVETDGIEFDNPYLADGSYFNPLNPNVDSHATAVAGIIASTHSTNKGIAYGVPALLSANAAGTSTADMVSAMEWATSNYASILQNSWGLPDPGYTMLPIDRYMDHVAWTNHKTIVVSA